MPHAQPPRHRVEDRAGGRHLGKTPPWGPRFVAAPWAQSGKSSRRRTGCGRSSRDAAPDPPAQAQGGGRRCDDRAVLAAIIFIAPSGCTWRQLPPVLGVPGGRSAGAVPAGPRPAPGGRILQRRQGEGPRLRCRGAPRLRASGCLTDVPAPRVNALSSTCMHQERRGPDP
ncbi:transposase [Streptomyces sp. IB201691-2A2]|nr:transposase [Streptomyces sp. IB201691-2A2]